MTSILTRFRRQKEDQEPKLKAVSLECSALLRTLEQSGCRVKSLRQGWRDEERKVGELYFLVPENTEDAHAGWFTVEELLAWTRHEGVIPKNALLERMDGLNEYGRRADEMLQEAGVRIRAKALAAWAVEESKLPGVRLLVHVDDQDILPDGIYSLSHLSVMLSLSAPALSE